MGFGTDLQQQRKARGIELEAIAAGTRVSIRHLRALEDEQRSELPGGIFNRGILRSYCRFLGLDEALWMERFAENPLGAVPEPDWSEFAENVRRNRASAGMHEGRRWGGVAAMALCLFALVWFAWSLVVAPRVRGQHLPAADGAHSASSEDLSRPPAR